MENFRGVICHDTKGDAEFKGKPPRALKNDIRNLVNFHASSPKSEICTLMGCLLSKAYKDLNKKGRKCYVS